MFKIILGDVYYAVKSSKWFFLIMAVPGLILALYGFNRLGAGSWDVMLLGGAQKYLAEFFFLCTLISLLHFARIKNSFVIAVILFVYFITLSADFVLLMYFKERFGAKYLETLAGGDYAFFKEWRMILFLVSAVAFFFIATKLLLKPQSRAGALFKFIPSFILMCVFAFVPFWKILPAPKDFYAAHMMPTPVGYMARALMLPEQKINFGLTPEVQAEAAKYALPLSAVRNGADKLNFDRIVMVTTEALSAKFISTYNPNVPPAASRTFDRLLGKYPNTLLSPGGLSTLYGLSAIFSGHPNGKMSYENGYPLSFVRVLKENGFKTVFLRGAPEDYMGEDIYFKEAGFEEVYGQNYFETQPEYKDHISWWGMTDRKLFEFAADFLQKNKKEKVFMNILTVDTHVPLGRTDYMGQEYPPLPEEKVYQIKNMASAFFRYDYDLGLFLENFERSGLLDERTLLIVTADHPFYANMLSSDLAKNYKPVFDKIPFILITKNALPLTLVKDDLASQSDIAPTILELAGLETPKGMFGVSLMEDAPRVIFDIKESYIRVISEGGVKIAPLTSKKEKNLIKLTNTYLKD